MCIRDRMYNNYKMLSQFDCGIIPLNNSNFLAWHKPANKLISFWFTGLPAIVSNTPAYTEMMNDLSEEMYCASASEWIAKTKEIYNLKPEEREALAKKNLDYVRKNYSDMALDVVWKEIFESLF